ncbi:MAG: thioredoxin [Planctomycetaceae bacterium]|nr:thioredoxin [Planctomycetaceae bacterium]
MSGTEPSAPAPRRGRLYKYVFLIACAAIAWHVMQVEERAPRQAEASAANPAPRRTVSESGGAVPLGASTFDQTIASGIHVVDFWAEWCGPCRTQGPIIDRFARNQAGKIGVGKVDVDQDGELADRYGIRAIPTILIFKNGEVAGRFTGVTDEATLVAAVQSLR